MRSGGPIRHSSPRSDSGLCRFASERGASFRTRAAPVILRSGRRSRRSRLVSRRVVEEAESADDGGERPSAPTRNVADDAVDTELGPRDAYGAPTAGQVPTSTPPTSTLPADSPADAPVAARVTPTSVSLDLQVFFELSSAVARRAHGCAPDGRRRSPSSPTARGRSATRRAEASARAHRYAERAR